MKKMHHNAEQIIHILRGADSGLSTEETCRKNNISSQTFYRWWNKYSDIIEISATALKGWIKALKRDCKLDVAAASQAQNAANLILGRTDE